MAENKVSHAVMEVSSQGLKQSRTAGLYFTVGMMTNISKDHIGKYEHKDMEEYMFYKSLLFRQCSIGFVNASDMLSGKALTHYGGRLAGCLYGGKKAWLPKRRFFTAVIKKRMGFNFWKGTGKAFSCQCLCRENLTGKMLLWQRQRRHGLVLVRHQLNRGFGVRL